MSINGSRVAIAGGSIAGCAAAIALGRAGCKVSIFERSASALEDRGSGIAIPIPLRETLVGAAYLPADYAHCAYERRLWITADGSPGGRVLWDQPSPVNTNNWSMLWAALRDRIGEASYHDGSSITDHRANGDGVTVGFADGKTAEFDLLVGADGYRSGVRARMQPEARQNYAGYILWRGNYREDRIPDNHPVLADFGKGAWHTIVFPGGHGIMYMIPDHDDRADGHHRKLNWAIYTATPSGQDFQNPHGVPPGGVDDALYGHLDVVLNRHFPPTFAELVRLSDVAEVSIQPIYDERVDHYTDGRVMLIGDAGCVTRPHTGSGATKALQDALALQELGTSGGDWASVLAAYDAERTAAGGKLEELGGRLGRAQVEETPEWDRMTPEDFEAWTRASLAGEKLYFYGARSRAAS